MRRVQAPSLDSLNPFRITGTTLPPNVLLMAKILALVFVLSGQLTLLPERFLPFLSLFDHVGSPEAFRRALQAVFLLAAVALFLNRAVRTNCLILGGVIFVGILASRQYFENNRLFTACLFVLAALCRPGETPRLLRYQVVLLYFGAALNKVLDSDWRTGDFFENWNRIQSYGSAYGHLSDWLPGLTLSVTLSWLVIVTEFAIASGFLFARTYAVTIFVGVAYHTTLFLLTGKTFGMFWYATLSAYLAFVKWPAATPTALKGTLDRVRSRCLDLLEALDLARAFRWRQQVRRGIEVVVEGKAYSGVTAGLRLILYNPALYLLFAGAAAASDRALRAASHPEVRWPALVAYVGLAAVAYEAVAARRRSAIPAPHAPTTGAL